MKKVNKSTTEVETNEIPPPQLRPPPLQDLVRIRFPKFLKDRTINLNDNQHVFDTDDEFGVRGSLLMRDFISLLPNTEINDDIINAYLELLNRTQEAEVYKYKFVFTTTVDNFFRNNAEIEDGRAYIPELGFNLQDYNRIFFPINISNYHWILVVINNTKKEVEYYDSLYKLKTKEREEDDLNPDIVNSFYDKYP